MDNVFLAQKIISIAPMLKLTDRHFRYILRQISQEAVLYTEMVPANAIACGKGLHLFDYNKEEKPLVLQLGGNNPEIMAQAAAIAEEYGYNEININAGCPSDRVAGAGLFGAALIKEPQLLANIFKKMQQSCSIPVTIKTRIGIRPNDSYDDLKQFIEILSEAGCHTFIIHARSAVLHKLSPKQNRKVVPLRPEIVYRLKQEKPNLKIIINGGVKTKEEVFNHLQFVDGVMIGEGIYKNPMLLADIYGVSKTRYEIVENTVSYMEQMAALGIRPKYVLRHLMGLFYATPYAKDWKKHLTLFSKLDNVDKNKLLDITAEFI
ncbi:MAG: tRNA dihydrouridine(20/20a) synthase DusA [Alphaproteobacteria bacterium]